MTATDSLPRTSSNVSDQNTVHSPSLTIIDSTATPAAATAARKAVNPVAYFVFAGRRWRIFKRRQPTRDELAAGLQGPPWQLYFESGGKRYSFSLGSPIKATAIARAKAIITAHQRQQDDLIAQLMCRPRKATVVYSRITDILNAVPDLPLQASARTRRGYAYALQWILRLAQDKPVEELTAGVLNGDTAAQFFSRVLARAATMPPAEAERWKRSAISIWNNALALFSPAAIHAMTRPPFNFVLPPLHEWRNARRTSGLISTATFFTSPSPHAQRAMLTEWVRIGRTPGYSIAACADLSHGAPLSELDRRNVFIAVGLMLAFGFRKSDVIRARWGWFEHDEQGWICRVRGETQKNRQTQWEIPALDPFWTILNRVARHNNWIGAPDELCLLRRERVEHSEGGLVFATGGHSDATEWPFRIIGRWLRSLGWTTQKTNHALRDYSASKITMRFGLTAAKLWCRHASQSTTERSYGRFVSRAELIDQRKLRWLKWAR